MLKTSSTESVEPEKGVVGVVGDSRARRDGRKIVDRNGINNVEVDIGEVGGEEVGKKGQKTSKNLSKSKKMVGLDFFTLGTRLAFTKWRQAFVKAPILYHFDPERYIRVETDVSGYAIRRFFNQLTLDNLGQ